MSSYRSLPPLSEFDLRDDNEFRLVQGRRTDEHEQLSAAHERIVQLKSRLLHSERLNFLGRISAKIMHDLNTPSAYVRSNLHLIHDYLQKAKALAPTSIPAEPPHRVVGDTGAVVADTQALPEPLPEQRCAPLQELLDNINELLDDTVEGMDLVTQIAANLNHLSRNAQDCKTEVDLVSCIERVIKLFTGQFAAPVQLHCDYQHAAIVFANEVELSQVFINLIQNALQALVGTGQITVATEKFGAYALVTIADTGCGMTEALTEKIFDDFFTVKTNGTGLGLAIAKDIVQRHHGHILLNSTPGEGSQFKILLPRVHAG